MNVTEELIVRVVKAGANIKAADGRLVVRAGAQPVPGQLVRDLREARADVLAMLSPTWWRRQFQCRAIDRELGGRRSSEDAARLAWGELECRWHRLYGERVPEWQCAGCGREIGNSPVLDLIDGNRVHLDTLDCLISYGERWRADATRALVAMGLEQPQS